MEETQSGPTDPRRPRKGRSPSYPGISLAEAEKRLRELYGAEKKHAAPVTAIVEHWGYSPTSSGGRTAVAALKKFGLLDDDGAGDERTARITELGVELVLNPDPATARRKAALLPRFHRQMWDEYGDNLPSAATLRYRLIKEFGFTEKGSEEFVAEYAATIAYAGLAGDKSGAKEAGPAEEIEKASHPGDSAQRSIVGPTIPTAMAARSTPGTPAGMTIPIPLLGEDPVYITGSFPLSEASWMQMIRVLEAMKPGLVDPGRNANLPPTASPAPRAPGEAEGGVRLSEYDSDDE